MSNLLTALTVSYKCDTCKRYIKLPKNEFGLDTLQECVITEGCLGTLYPLLVQTEINKAEVIPPAVAGLQDWTPRKIFYKHTQAVPSQKWLIQHNLGVKPVVEVWVNRQLADGTFELVRTIPNTITILDPNNVTVTFTNTETGIAECISSSSGFDFVVTPPTVAELNQLLTTNNELTIATTDASADIQLQITYISKGVPITITYGNVDNQPSINTPWVSTTTVFLNGRTYAVRSFNFLTHPFATSIFNSNLIADGSPFFFNEIQGVVPSQPEQNFILLSKAPYLSPIDRVNDQLIDIASINRVTPQPIYSSGELVTPVSIIKKVYPPVLAVD